MKIAIISTVHAPWGGSEELWFQLASAALDQGHRVEVSMVYTGKLSPKVLHLLDRGMVLHKRRGYIPNGLSRSRRILLKGWNLVKNFLDNPYRPLFKSKPDIIVHHGSLYQVSEDRFFSKLLDKHKTPLIIVSQIIAEYGRKMSNGLMLRLRKDYQYARKVLFVSRRNMETASRHIAASIPNGEVITNPVNMKDFTIVEYPPINDGLVKLATLGNLLVDHKGQDLLLEVLGQEKWKERRWQLDIYGAGPDEEYLKDLCRFYGIEDKVSFRGFANDIRKVWMDHHMLIMPSLMEGLPLAMVEAMLCGRPVLATDVGGHRELIEEGINGFIAAAPCTFSIDQALEKAWEKRADWKRMGEAAHHSAKSYFVPDIGQKFLDMLISELQSS